MNKSFVHFTHSSKPPELYVLYNQHTILTFLTISYLSSVLRNTELSQRTGIGLSFACNNQNRMMANNPFRPSRPRPSNQDDGDLERLRSLTGFGAVSGLGAWLDSDGVKPFFREFRQDYLADNTNADEPDFHQVMLAIGASDALGAAGLNRYTAFAPNKQNWATKDHFARFHTQVKRYALRNYSSWPGAAEQDLSILGNELFEVLLYLVRKWRSANLTPPR